MFSIPPDLIFPIALMSELMAGVVLGFLLFYR